MNKFISSYEYLIPISEDSYLYNIKLRILKPHNLVCFAFLLVIIVLTILKFAVYDFLLYSCIVKDEDEDLDKELMHTNKWKFDNIYNCIPFSNL